jgi:hypothetical protein
MAKIEKYTRNRDVAEGAGTAATKVAKQARNKQFKATDLNTAVAQNSTYKSAKKSALKDINASLAANQKVKTKLGVKKK